MWASFHMLLCVLGGDFCISSWKVYSIFFTHYIIRFLVASLLGHSISLFTLYINTLSKYGLQINLFSLSIPFLFNMLIVSFAMEFLKFYIVSCVYFCYCYLCFWCHIWEIIAHSNIRIFIPEFFLGILKLTVLYLCF